MRVIPLAIVGFSIGLMADFSRDNTTQIVTDNNRGLQWQDDVNVTKSWIEAIDYCESLILGGYSDWRLPNFNELYSLADKSKSRPAIDSIFRNVYNNYFENYYWSSTTVIAYKNSAWRVNFVHGGSNTFSRGGADVGNKNSLYHVRCVRAGQ